MADTDRPTDPVPDTPTSPVTVGRVAEILKAENLDHRLESAAVGSEETPITVVRTGFDNAAITFTVHEDLLIVEALWRGVFAVDQAARVLTWVNTWNQTHFAPTMRFFEQTEGSIVASAIDLMPVAEGMSRNQIAVFVLASIENIVRAFRELDEDFPDLVTWTEDHHDHS